METHSRDQEIPRVDSASSRSDTFESLFARLVAATAPGKSRPVSIAAAPVGYDIPLADTPVAVRACPEVSTPPAPEVLDGRSRFDRAWGRLCALSDVPLDAGLREHILLNAAALPISLSDRPDTFVRATFRLLAERADPFPGAALLTFATDMLGSSAQLIEPQYGEPLSDDCHNDVSRRTSGPRCAVRMTVFPGVACGEETIVRAIVHS